MAGRCRLGPAPVSAIMHHTRPGRISRPPRSIVQSTTPSLSASPFPCPNHSILVCVTGHHHHTTLLGVALRVLPLTLQPLPPPPGIPRTRPRSTQTHLDRARLPRCPPTQHGWCLQYMLRPAPQEQLRAPLARERTRGCCGPPAVPGK